MKKKNIFFLFFALSVVLSSYAQNQNDTDKDGIPDSQDVCPFEKGTIANKGCPVSNVKKEQQAETDNYKQALEKLNTFLQTFGREVERNQFLVEKDTIFVLYKGQKYYQFHHKDVRGATIAEYAKSVDIYCTGEDKCIEYIDYRYEKDERLKGLRFQKWIFFVTRNPNSGMNAPYNYAVLANLLNNFLFAVKKQSIPPSMVYDETKYAVTKTVEEEALANAKTPLEKAVAEFSVFAKNLYIDNSYINKVSYESVYGRGNLIIEYISTIQKISLENMDGVMLYRNAKSGYSKIEIFSNTKHTDYWGNYTKAADYWTEVSNQYADTFFVLLGNIVEAYKEQTIKKYKPGLSYQQRLAFLKNAEHVVIETKSVVKLLNASKEEKYYGALKKRKGDNFDVSDDLYLNPDLRTYHGELYHPNGLGKLLNIEVEFISAPPGITAEELKKKKEEKQADSLLTVLAKEHYKTITEMSKKTSASEIELMSKNGFTFIDESIVKVFMGFNNDKAYGTSYTLDPNTTYVFVVNAIQAKEVTVNYGNNKINVPALEDDPYFAKVTKPLVTTSDGLSQYILTLSPKLGFKGKLNFEVYGDFFQYAYIRRYKKK